MDEQLDNMKRDIVSLLKRNGVVSVFASTDSPDGIVFQRLTGDGSARIFLRILQKKCPLCIAVFPPDSSKKNMAEFRSTYQIAKHLHAAGIPVPKIIAVEEKAGLILFEDLGDIRLHEQFMADRENGGVLLKETVKILAEMQVIGAVDFKNEYCFDAPSYDKKTMIDRESSYFLEAFWKQTLFEGDVVGLNEEFEYLADQIIGFFEPLFFHRDFQSRNIMICNDRVRVIDFQAGRLGPPGYDIASMLIDPYIGLSDTMQADLFEEYLHQLGNLSDINIERVRLSYPYLASQRNLQIIGAFAYLSGRKSKSFFKQYILPSLIMLQNRLAEKELENFPVLRKTVSLAILKYRRYLQG